MDVAILNRVDLVIDSEGALNNCDWFLRLLNQEVIIPKPPKPPKSPNLSPYIQHQLTLYVCSLIIFSTIASLYRPSGPRQALGKSSSHA